MAFLEPVAGKGFVVVAGEVKTLASQTARATANQVLAAADGLGRQAEDLRRTVNSVFERMRSA